MNWASGREWGEEKAGGNNSFLCLPVAVIPFRLEPVTRIFVLPENIHATLKQRRRRRRVQRPDKYEFIFYLGDLAITRVLFPSLQELVPPEMLRYT